MSPSRTKHPIRILHLANGMPVVGGEPESIKNIIAGLNHDEFQCMLCLTDPLPKSKQRPLEDFNIIPLHRTHSEHAWYYDFSFPLKLARAARRHHIDIIHSHGILMNTFGAPAARLAGAKALCTCHMKPFDVGRGIIARIWPYLTDHYTAVGAEIIKSIANWLHMPQERIECVPNGIHLERFEVGDNIRKLKRKELGVTDDTLVIGATGRLTEQKNPLSIIQTAHKVTSACPNSLFIIAGEGEMHSEVKRYIRQMQLENRVRLLGPRLDIPELLSAMDIFLHLALWEGLSLSIIEAMAAGKAIVAARAPGVSEILRHGKSALLVPPSQPEEAAGAILRLVGDPKLRESLAAGAHADSKAHSVNKVVEAYARIYRRLARTNTPRKATSPNVSLKDGESPS